MKKQTKTIFILIAFIALLAGAFILYNALSDGHSPDDTVLGESPSGNDNPNKAVDFFVYGDNGRSVKLSDFFGKPIVLNFWASWCAPCKSEMPDFEEAYSKYGDKVQFIMINLTDGARETISSAKSFISSQKYSFPVFFDTDESAAASYAVSYIPRTVFINKDGKIVYSKTGVISAGALEDGIEKILS